MLKSLYYRVVIVYLGVVFLSLIFGIVLSLLMYWEKSNTEMEDQLREQALIVQDLYNHSQPDDLFAFMETTAKLSFLSIELFDHDSGETLRFNQNRENIVSNIETEVTVAWENDGILYDMTIRNHLDEGSGKEFLTFISIILGTGCLLVLIATSYVVKPVKALTIMANKISKGDFTVRLPSRRNDELGSLAKAINQMAIDLGQLETVRQEFVANVSHEFQSPLTSIKGFSVMLQKGEFSEAEETRALQIIIEESNRLSRLSDNLLKLAALDVNSHNLHPTLFDLAEQIRRSVLAFEPHWTEKQIQVEMNAEKTLITADEDLINQIWTNLISNAVKFTPPGGKINISLRTIGEQVEVSFFDSGEPISEAEIERIFNRFHKTDRMRDRKVDGNGLGLSIVKKIVELHGGVITVNNSYDSGKSFVVVLLK